MASNDLRELALRNVVERTASPDGWARDPELEERINDACRSALNGPVGDLVMDYIKSITLNAVLPDTATDAQLRGMEGMRRLCGILDYRRKTTPKKR